MGHVAAAVMKTVRENNTFLEHFPNHQSLIPLLQSSEYNWFEFIDRVESVVGDIGANEKQLEEFRSTMDNDVLKLSYEASRHELYAEDRTARYVNGEIVSETESDNPTDYILTSSTSTSALVEKKRKAIQRRARRQRAKLIAEQRFLSRKVGKRISKIMTECPDIGKTMEKFVEEHVLMRGGGRAGRTDV